MTEIDQAFIEGLNADLLNEPEGPRFYVDPLGAQIIELGAERAKRAEASFQRQGAAGDT